MTASTCPVVLAFGLAWAVISAIFVLAGITKEAKKWSWFWAVSFAASSLVAAYCFRQLVWGESDMSAMGLVAVLLWSVLFGAAILLLVAGFRNRR